MHTAPGVTTRIFQDGSAWAYEIERPAPPIATHPGTSPRSILTGVSLSREGAESAVAQAFLGFQPAGSRRVEGIYTDAECRRACETARGKA